MRRWLFLLLLALSPSLSMGQQLVPGVSDCSSVPVFVGSQFMRNQRMPIPISSGCQNSQAAVSGATVRINNNVLARDGSFEYVITGSPSGASIPLKGCKAGGTCDTCDTYTGTSNSIRDAATFSTSACAGNAYDYFTITPTFTGGSAPKLTVNTTLTTAAIHGGSSGGTGTPSGSTGDIQTNAGSGNFGAAHINDNATTMKVTESITPNVAAANNLGTAPLPFGDGYFGGAANHSFHFDTSTVASNVAVAVPNHASNTVQGIADPSDTQTVNYIGTDGVLHRIAAQACATCLLETTPTQYGTIYGNGTQTTLNVTPPTVNGYYFLGHIVTGSAAVAPTATVSTGLPAGFAFGTVDTGAPKWTASTNLWTSNQPVAAPSFTSAGSGGVAGLFQWIAGTAPTPVANTANYIGPASAPATAFSIATPIAIFTTGHLIDTTVSGAVATWHDSSIVTANVVNASSPGAGVAHFAGSTQTETSSAVNLAGGSNEVTGVLPATNMAAVTLATGTSVSLSAPSEIYVCTSTCTVTPPVPVSPYGQQFCVFNDDNVSTVITLAALGSSAKYEATARISYGTAGTGTLVSGGAVKDMICIVGRDSTHYITTNFIGTWTAN